MSLIDYVRDGDYEELMPYIGSRSECGQLLNALYKLTDIVRMSEKRMENVEALFDSLDWEYLSSDSHCGVEQYYGSPQSPEGKRWIQSLIDYYGPLGDKSVKMMENALCINWSGKTTRPNPKCTLRNYNRSIASDVAIEIDSCWGADYVVFITASSQYAFTEVDAAQIKGYLKQIEEVNDVAVHLFVDDRLEDSIMLEWCMCERDGSVICVTNPSRINQTLDDLFAQEPKVMLLWRDDFDLVMKHYDVCCLYEIITQKGVDDMIQLLKRHLPYNIAPNAQTITMCVELSKEIKSDYALLMKLLDAIKEMYPHIFLKWGARENNSLPVNSIQATILADIPDDCFNRNLSHIEV